jgi:hypothetical protein
MAFLADGSLPDRDNAGKGASISFRERMPTPVTLRG